MHHAYDNAMINLLKEGPIMDRVSDLSRMMRSGMASKSSLVKRLWWSPFCPSCCKSYYMHTQRRAVKPSIAHTCGAGTFGSSWQNRRAVLFSTQAGSSSCRILGNRLSKCQILKNSVHISSTCLSLILMDTILFEGLRYVDKAPPGLHDYIQMSNCSSRNSL